MSHLICLCFSIWIQQSTTTHNLQTVRRSSWRTTSSQVQIRPSQRYFSLRSRSIRNNRNNYFQERRNSFKLVLLVLICQLRTQVSLLLVTTQKTNQRCLLRKYFKIKKEWNILLINMLKKTTWIQRWWPMLTPECKKNTLKKRRAYLNKYITLF